MKKTFILATGLALLVSAQSFASTLDCVISENNQGELRPLVTVSKDFDAKGTAKVNLGSALGFSVSALSIGISSNVTAIDAQAADGNASSSEGEGRASLKIRGGGHAFEFECTVKN